MGSASIIAIDGPAGSGKSTLGRKLAENLAYLYFDTGVLYRAVACIALVRSLDVGDEPLITTLAENLNIDVQPPSQKDGRENDVLVDGEDITWKIRTPDVDGNVSVVAAYPGVRKALIEMQRRIGLRGRIVMVGRDIGTIVLPEADVKIYLNASVEERARRRYEERCSRGEEVSLDEILESMRKRDQIDSTREFAPLKPAEDAVHIDSDRMDADQVLQSALEIVRASEKTNPGG
jgi:cytidylate kinase